MSDDEKRMKAVAWLRSRGRYLIEGAAGVTWNPSKVDVEETIKRELDRLAGKVHPSARLRSIR